VLKRKGAEGVQVGGSQGVSRRRGSAEDVRLDGSLTDWDTASANTMNVAARKLARTRRVINAKFALDFFFMGLVSSYSFLSPPRWFVVIAGPDETKNRAG
jgi:hypothetical protein